MLESNIMLLRIYINDRLYKTITINDTKYDPKAIYDEIMIDKQSGLLSSFQLEKGMAIRYEKVA